MVDPYLQAIQHAVASPAEIAAQREAVDKCTSMCYESKGPDPDEIEWTVKHTLEALSMPLGEPTYPLEQQSSLGPEGFFAAGPLGQRELKLSYISSKRRACGLYQTKRQLMRLCTALLACNHLNEEQKDLLKSTATMSVEGNWETLEDCVAYLDTLKQGMSARYVYKLVWNSNGFGGDYVHTNSTATLESVESTVSTAITASLEAGGEVYGGKMGLEMSLEQIHKNATNKNVATSGAGTFKFPDLNKETGQYDIYGVVYEKLCAVTKHGITHRFVVLAERFSEKQMGEQFENHE